MMRQAAMLARARATLTAADIAAQVSRRAIAFWYSSHSAIPHGTGAAVGVAAGFLMHRSGFCLAGAFRKW